MIVLHGMPDTFGADAVQLRVRLGGDELSIAKNRCFVKGISYDNYIEVIVVFLCDSQLYNTRIVAHKACFDGVIKQI